MCVFLAHSLNVNFPDEVLTDAASTAIWTAIWNRYKAVTAVSIIIWGTGVAFHIEGQLFPLIFL